MVQHDAGGRIEVLTEANLPGIPRRQGKVRDIFDFGDTLLFVATDRLSAFDVVLPDGIPRKGEVLTRISLFWFNRLSSILKNHVVESVIERYPEKLREHAQQLAGRSMLVRKTTPFPVECIVRGYLSGSAWKEYRQWRSVCGIPLPEGLKESSRLPEPIFTPSTKAEIGVHDENLSLDEAAKTLGEETAACLRDASISLYRAAAEYAETRGIIIADTKFEFGRDPGTGEIILIDEVLTPDSSRFWPADCYVPGRSQPSFDKQFVRDYLELIQWDKKPPAPRLPQEVIRQTSEKYVEAYERLVGSPLPA